MVKKSNAEMKTRKARGAKARMPLRDKLFVEGAQHHGLADGVTGNALTKANTTKEICSCPKVLRDAMAKTM